MKFFSAEIFKKKKTPVVSGDVVKKKLERKVIYGVTDQSRDPIWIQIDDFLIDTTPVSKKEKSLFFNSLQLLVKSGIRITRAIEMLAERIRNRRFQRILRTIAYDLRERGLKMSDAMAKYSDVFSNSEIKMIYSGELSGKIDDILDKIALQIQKNIKIHMQIKSALMYPMTVFSAIFFAGIIVMIFVVPQFKALFSSFGEDMPTATKILIGTSDFIAAYWWLLITGLIAGWLFFQNWRTSRHGKLQWDAFLLQIPGLKYLIRNYQTVQVASNFSTLLSSGVSVVVALKVLSQIVDSSVIARDLKVIEHRVATGESMHKCFAESEWIDPILSEIIEVGEQSSSVAEILGTTSEQYELELDTQLNNLTKLIEPIIIVIVGAAVVFMALAIMVPIFRLQQSFAG